MELNWLGFLFLASLTSLLVQGVPTGLNPFGDPDYTDSLQIREGLDVTWEVYNANQTVIFDLTCNCTGWVGFGINENGVIVPGDIVMGGIDGDKGPYFKDRFAVVVGQPYIDQSQDWHLINAFETDGITRLRFHRLFDTGDEEDLPITNKTVKFIWAVGRDDFINDESLIDTPYHGSMNRGNVSVQILRDTKAL